jgi:hypothetical protein
MISNPCRFYISDGKEKSFTHEGGKHLFHFSPYDNKLSISMEMNIVFFANSEEHGLDILKRMFEFMIDCKIEYLKNENESKSVHASEFERRAKNDCNRAVEIIKAIDSGMVRLEKVPMNQFFKVGWALNDTL